jgi:hypothetical protein
MRASGGLAICPFIPGLPPSSLESSDRFPASREISALTTFGICHPSCRKTARSTTFENLFSANYEPSRRGVRTAFRDVEAAKKMNNDFRPCMHEETRSAGIWWPMHGLAAIFLLALFSPAQTIAAVRAGKITLGRSTISEVAHPSGFSTVRGLTLMRTAISELVFPSAASCSTSTLSRRQGFVRIEWPRLRIAQWMH